MPYLEQLGFNLVGYGCTTCIGNSGPLPDAMSQAIQERRPGRRRGAERQSQLRRPHPSGGARELPGLAAAGRRLRARRHDRHRPRPPNRSATAATASRSICKDIWPTQQRSAARRARQSVTPRCSSKQYAERLRRRRPLAERCRCPTGDLFAWDDDSTYIKKPPYFEDMSTRADAASATSTARACCRCSATASRPITSRRPVRSRRTAPPASI